MDKIKSIESGETVLEEIQIIRKELWEKWNLEVHIHWTLPEIISRYYKWSEIEVNYWLLSILENYEFENDEELEIFWHLKKLAKIEIETINEDVRYEVDIIRSSVAYT